ncbi:ribosome biosynthesis protein nip7 [Cymbomonas tetramitiformis]|uniref:60S ribosome subunit biogenesis protein NIP7 homolog n=1 Tax=Cymbomonas tetramitiformis TaxID=36881 RepID=A0AAE0GXT4_9CHLO|nr:ribosome biosynthesis protein nip7 [Cymbomonas tetramitiformis]|eukprot:gene10081-11933_t
MRPLEEDEAKQVFEKLHKYVGKNLKDIIDQPNDPHCMRLHRNKVFYVREEIMRRATNISRKQLVSLGTCLGKFTHSGKFRLTIQSLQVIAQYAKYKVWIKPSAEMSFLYGNHVLKSGLGRITENTPSYQGVVVLNMTDIPLGFGTTARSTQDCRKLDPGQIVTFHQADTGEYLRSEEEM